MGARLLLTITGLLFLSFLKAQVAENPEKVVEGLMESLSENDVDLNNQSQVFDDLIELYERPVNINRLGKEDLEKLVFLSDIQVESLMEFLEKMKPINSMFQLQGVEGFCRTDIERLSMFVRYDEIETDVKHRKYLSGQLILRDQFELENAKGYKTDTTSSGYLGDKHHMYSKLQLKYGDGFSAGLVLDKDPGEELTPIDFVSGYAMYHGDKWLKTLIVGDYHANFGQGLTLWTGTSMGKTSEPLSVRKRGSGFKKYSSANEYAFFRGVATTVRLNKADISLFASHKDRDASFSYLKDSAFSVVESMPETGYHRTQTEMDKRKQLTQTTAGVNIGYRLQNLSLSVGGFVQKYDADSVAVKELYRYMAHEKAESSHCWLSYNYGLGKLLLFGEAALADDGSPAVINGLQFKPANNVSVAMLYRCFSSKYYSPWTNAFAENSFPAGESGFYLGMNVYPLPNVKLSGYIDVFKTKWLKYNVDKPSEGYDVSFQGDYEFNSSFKVYVRYREKEKMKNVTVEDLSDFNVVSTNIKKVRLHTDGAINKNWAVQARVEKSFYKQESQDDTKGTLAYAGLKFTSSSSRISCWLRYLVFDTENYDSRLYAYENDLLYNFYTPAFQGDGTRVYAMVRYEIVRNVKFWLKAGRTIYNDRDIIGSGLQEVDGNVKTNLRMQLQIKF